MLVNSRFPSSFVSKSGKFKKILGGGGGGERECHLKPKPSFLLKKKNQKLCVLKKK